LYLAAINPLSFARQKIEMIAQILGDFEQCSLLKKISSNRRIGRRSGWRLDCSATHTQRKNYGKSRIANNFADGKTGLTLLERENYVHNVPTHFIFS
jgi:hypothetical protein